MKSEPKKKLPNKKVISSAKFEAKEQFTKSALENLKTENERLVKSLKKSGEIKESKNRPCTFWIIFLRKIQRSVVIKILESFQAN